jgi:hypothetical protein
MEDHLLPRQRELGSSAVCIVVIESSSGVTATVLRRASAESNRWYDHFNMFRQHPE